MIDVALRKLILEHAPAASVVPSTEVGIVAQGLPKVAYTLISAPRGLTDSGPVRLITARYQLDIFAATLTAARTITASLASGLHGYGPATVDNTPILLVAFDEESFGTTVPAAGANAAAARVQQDVSVTYRE